MNGKINTVYATWDNNGCVNYLYNGVWYPFADKEIHEDTAKQIFAGDSYFSLTEDRVSELGLNNAEVYLKFTFGD